jgi:hypothetical protein
MKLSYGVTVTAAVLVATALPGGMAKAASTSILSNAAAFDARADSAASSYCVDVPAVLVGQQICGGFIRSSVTATTDPRGYALGGLAPVPKLSSVPLLIPNNFQGIPVPDQVQQGLKQIKFNNIPSQCQASYPAVNEGDDDQTCGGPSYGDSALGFIGSGANAHVFSTGDQSDPTQTRTTADTRAVFANLTGLQSTYDNVRALSESGLNADGNPMGDARMNAGRVTFLGGAFTIDNIVSATRVAFDGTKKGTAASTSFTFGGASFAGIPVDITADGLTVATNQVPADQVKALTMQLDSALANNNGFGVKLLPAPPVQVTDSLVSATSGGIQVTYRGSTGTDVVYTQTLGVTSAQVSAVPARAADVATSAGASGGISSAQTGTDGIAAPSTGASLPGTVDLAAGDVPAVSGVPGTNTSLPTVSLQQQVGDQTLFASFPGIAPLASSRVKDIYPVFCVLLLAAFVVARLRRRPMAENLD